MYRLMSLLLDLFLTLFRVFLSIGCATFRFFIPNDERSVTNDIVLVTGAAHGIGKEVANQYAKLGAQVVCVDINGVANEANVVHLRQKGFKVRGYTCDVTNREAVLALDKKIREDMGFVTILVNNAGVMPNKRFLDHSPQDINRLFNINILSQFWTLEAFLPAMIANDYGHIVALSSVAGLAGYPYLAPYCATKCAITGLMSGLAAELREEKRNISCTTVYPFTTDTGLCKRPTFGFPSLLGMQTPEKVAARIISAQRRGRQEVSIPFFMLTLDTVFKLLPIKSKQLIFDFLKTGTIPTD